MKKKKKTVVLFDEVVKTKRRGVVAVLPWGGLPHKEPVTLRFRRPSLAAFSAADFELVEPKERSFVEVNTTPLTSGARELREFRPVVNLTTCSDNLYNQKVCSIAKVLLLEEKFYVYEIVSSYVARNSSLKQDPRSSTCSAWRRNSTAAHSLSATDTHTDSFWKRSDWKKIWKEFVLSWGKNRNLKKMKNVGGSSISNDADVFINFIIKGLFRKKSWNFFSFSLLVIRSVGVLGSLFSTWVRGTLLLLLVLPKLPDDYGKTISR